jgi:hypothetical protein
MAKDETNSEQAKQEMTVNKPLALLRECIAHLHKCEEENYVSGAMMEAQRAYRLMQDIDQAAVRTADTAPIVRELRDQVERLQSQLYGCSSVALGWPGAPVRKGDHGWSEDCKHVLDLRKEFEALDEEMEKARGRIEDYERLHQADRERIAFLEHELSLIADAARMAISGALRKSPPAQKRAELMVGDRLEILDTNGGWHAGTITENKDAFWVVSGDSPLGGIWSVWKTDISSWRTAWTAGIKPE